MRGYLGSSTKARPKQSGNKSKGNANRRLRRRPAQDEYPDDEGSLEVISPEQLEVLSACAEEYSDNILHVTTRQDFQLHFVHIEDTPDLMRRLAAVGIRWSSASVATSTAVA